MKEKIKKRRKDVKFDKPSIIFNPKTPKKWMGLMTPKEIKLFAELALIFYVGEKNFDKKKFGNAWNKVVEKINEKISKRG